MGWGGFTDPAEQAAANEAAAKMEQARAEADGRTEALAAAILEGFAMLATAIRAAAGITAPGLGDIYQGQLDDVAARWPKLGTENANRPMCRCGDPTSPNTTHRVDGPCYSVTAAPDPDLDDLLSTDDQGQEKS